MLKTNIEPLNNKDIKETQKLVNMIFPLQNIIERLSFFGFTHRENKVVKLLMKLFKIYKIFEFWIIRDIDSNRIIGTTGLYFYNKDFNEAIWLAWFCVSPDFRNKGIGSKLLTFTINHAKKTGSQYLRLYTSDDPIEKKAQSLYEKHGLKIFKIIKKLFYSEYYRELKLYKNKSE